jgi:hypothetical protein
MSNVERLRVQQETVDLLLNKFQRHRGDTLNSRMYFAFLAEQWGLANDSWLLSDHLSNGDFAFRRDYWREACSLVSTDHLHLNRRRFPKRNEDGIDS